MSHPDAAPGREPDQHRRTTPGDPREPEDALAPAPFERLSDTGTGCYEVATETATYLIDLTRRRLQRIPRTSPPPPGPTDPPLPPVTVVRHFDVDHGWVPLVELQHCQRGAEMRARAIVDEHVQPWRTATVLRINRSNETNETNEAGERRAERVREPGFGTVDGYLEDRLSTGMTRAQIRAELHTGGDDVQRLVHHHQRRHGEDGPS